MKQKIAFKEEFPFECRHNGHCLRPWKCYINYVSRNSDGIFWSKWLCKRNIQYKNGFFFFHFDTSFWINSTIGNGKQLGLFKQSEFRRLKKWDFELFSQSFIFEKLKKCLLKISLNYFEAFLYTNTYYQGIQKIHFNRFTEV